jgi:hypothetical protein
VYSIGIGIHLGNYLFFGIQPYAFRSDRIIPLTKTTVATSHEFSCLCWTMLAIFIFMKHLEILMEYLLFLRVANIAVLEYVEVAKALAPKNGYELVSKKEWFGLDVSKCFGSMVSTHATTVSFIRCIARMHDMCTAVSCSLSHVLFP